MARTLDVYLHYGLIGTLTQEDSGEIRFAYLPGWLQNPDARPLSHSLPLRSEPFSRHECSAFFGGILPEDLNRKLIARILGISENNDFAMLAEIGGECAGAVTFLPQGTPLPDKTGHQRQLTDEALAGILRALPERPLLAGTDELRLSLAGAQDKIALCVDDDGISLPLGNTPSTHIIKPGFASYDGIVANEAFCMQLASAAGLPAADTRVGQVEDIDYLLVKRFDREISDGEVLRLHQEDFCQALGVVSDRKYEAEGGPGLADCFALLRAASSTPARDLLSLLDLAVFNILIGNHDAHAKNFALCYALDGTTRLAPAYDLVSTVVYPELTDRMAMRMGQQSRSDLVTLDDFAALAQAAGLGPAQVQRRVREVAAKVRPAIDKIEQGHEIAREIAEIVEERSRRLAA